MRSLRMIVPTVTVILGLTLAGCSSSQAHKTPTAAETQSAEAEAAAAPANEATNENLIEVPDVVGKAGDDAKEILKEAGLKHEWDAGTKSVFSAKNWTVDAQDPAAGEHADKGSKVTLTVSKPKTSKPAPIDSGRDAAPAPTEDDPRSEVTSTGLNYDNAHTACYAAVDREFIYGGKAHWITGVLATKIVDDRWFFKVNASPKNEHGTKMSATVECYVVGTNENPVVDEFLLY